MVDVGEKQASVRTAVARAVVRLPPAAAKLALNAELQRKGSVAHVAVVAGVMAAKRTSELIPLCHLLALDKVHVDVGILESRGEEGEAVAEIRCTVSATHKTGVEMEALVGASVAALTVYDMLKSASHGIVVERVELLSKTGGKRDFSSPGAGG